MSVIQNNHSEGPVAKAIENQTAKLPSDLFLWAALGAMATSATLKAMGKKHTALFVGQWAPSFLLLGIYNKLVKVEGNDKYNKNGGYGKGSVTTEQHPISDYAEPEKDITV